MRPRTLTAFALALAAPALASGWAAGPAAGMAGTAAGTATSPSRAAAVSPYTLYADYSSGWFKSADESVWPHDSLVARYRVERYGAGAATLSYGPVRGVFYRVAAARAGGVLVLQSVASAGVDTDAARRMVRLSTTGQVLRRYTSTRAYQDADLGTGSGWLVTLERGGGADPEYVVVRQRLDGTGARVLFRFTPTLRWGIPALVLSPSGHTAYLLHPTGAARARITGIRLASGRWSAVRELRGNQFRGLDVSPDAQRLLVTFDPGSRPSYPMVLPFNHPSSRLAVEGVTARYSPDGGQVYVTQRGLLDTATIGEVSWRNGSLKRIVLASRAVRTVGGVSVDVAGRDLEVLRP
jgi:hypothetical protein